MKPLLCLLLVLLTGCVPIRHNGKTYYVVVGAGVIRVSQTNDVTVVRARSLGFYAGDGHANIGLSSVYVARVPTNANVVLDIKE
jgi:hypothetical protein